MTGGDTPIYEAGGAARVPAERWARSPAKADAIETVPAGDVSSLRSGFRFHKIHVVGGTRNRSPLVADTAAGRRASRKRATVAIRTPNIMGGRIIHNLNTPGFGRKIGICA